MLTSAQGDKKRTFCIEKIYILTLLRV